MTIILPQCLFCRNYHRDGGEERASCIAFPNGIPAMILGNTRDHRNLYPGDHGIRFDPVDAEAGHIVEEMFQDREP